MKCRCASVTCPTFQGAVRTTIGTYVVRRGDSRRLRPRTLKVSVCAVALKCGLASASNAEVVLPLSSVALSTAMGLCSHWPEAVTNLPPALPLAKVPAPQLEQASSACQLVMLSGLAGGAAVSVVARGMNAGQLKQGLEVCLYPYLHRGLCLWLGGQSTSLGA